MKKAKLLLASAIVGILTVPVVVVPGETIALWNFNETSGGAISDQVTSGGSADGVASANVQIVSGGSLGTGFGSARDFSVAGSYVELGEITSTKLDLNSKTSMAIEAMIYLTSDATTPAMIFDNRQVQLQVINNKLAAFVRQGSGFKGILSSSTLQKNTPYRVGAHLNNGYLIITIADKVAGNVKISEPIQAAEVGAVAFIGGDYSSMNFPGIIDDIRLSNVATLDTVPPVISLVSPDVSVPTIDGNPTFTFDVTDNEDQIDPTSIVVKLNGQSVSGLTYNPSTHQLSGQLSSALVAGKKNYIYIEAKDDIGNPAFAQYEIRYIHWGSGEEYANDSDTLGLWHLNDHGASFAKDSSSFSRHGKYKGTQPVPGVIGQARLFAAQYATEEIILPPVPVPGDTFTFEAWLRPLSDNTAGMPIFNNGQFSISRTELGSVRVNLMTYYQTHMYTTVADILPPGKWSHLKVVYDGTRNTENMLVLIDGLVVHQFDAVPNCQFDEEPKVATIGGLNFRGEIDEIRVSKSIRESTNLIRGNPPTVELANPLEGSTVRSPNLNIYAKIFDAAGISPTNVTVTLNGVSQSGGGLVISGTEVKGLLPSTLNGGLNEIEIRVKGQSGNQTVLQRRFFYVKDNGLVEYSADANTVGLWHFNEDGGQNFSDSSGNGRSILAATPALAVTGKLGRAILPQHGQIETGGFKFPGKSFTMEAWVKLDSASIGALPVMTLSGDQMSTSLLVENESVKINWAVPGAPFVNIEIPHVFAINEFKHVALTYNATADNANIAVLVNGIVRYSRSFRSSCNACMSDLKLSINSNPAMVIDEARLSSISRSEFNIGSGAGPSIGFTQTVPGSTVHVSQPVFSVHFSDDDSIDQATMSLAINGVVDTSLNKTVSGTTGTLSGTPSLFLQDGANEITVRAKNQNGQESVDSFIVYYIAAGAPTAYSTDSNTAGLWHFNNGDLSQATSDVSGRAFNWYGVSDLNIVTGVFAEAARLSGYNYISSSASAIPTTQSWTFEAWLATTGDNSYDQSFDGQNILSLQYDGGIGFGIGTLKYTPPGTLVADGKFHHVAIIVDSANPYKNILLVVDGRVVDSIKNSSLPTFEFSAASGLWRAISLDEMRLSSVPRYTLNYQRPAGTLFKNAKKLSKLK